MNYCETSLVAADSGYVTDVWKKVSKNFITTITNKYKQMDYNTAKPFLFGKGKEAWNHNLFT